MAMNIAFDKGMTVDEFLAWAETQPREAGKFELLDGVVIVQQSQRWAHAKLKYEVFDALRGAIKQAGLHYFAAPEGPTVRIHQRKAFEPDALVAALPEPEPDSLEVPNPIVVVEVLSPSTTRMDTTVKLQGYFEVESIRHYLIVDPERKAIIHHRRSDKGVVETVMVTAGELRLAPPGLSISLGDLFGS
jgi:Uma2 family endonuclease